MESQSRQQEEILAGTRKKLGALFPIVTIRHTSRWTEMTTREYEMKLKGSIKKNGSISRSAWSIFPIREKRRDDVQITVAQLW